MISVSMAQRIPIQLHVGNALQWLGTLYRNPADALKEHVSNAIDEHLKAKLAGVANERCHIRLTLDKRQVIVEYPYGLSRAEFEAALRRVADSEKRASAAGTIGRLGIGIFSFQQIGRRCTFYTRKTAAAETLRVVLKEGSDEASMETALARDALAQPGLRVVISELKFDPMRSRGPLAPDTLRRYLADKFEAYLREGWLTIAIRVGIVEFDVTPARIRLPRLLAGLETLALPRHPDRKVRLDVYFDASGRGGVAIRHRGVTVVENLASLAAYGLEDSAWAEGYVRGVLDADFLTPLPARSGFEENEDWIALLDLLDRYLPTLRAELDGHLAAHRAREVSPLPIARCGWHATSSTSTNSAIWRCPEASRNAGVRSRRQGPNRHTPGRSTRGRTSRRSGKARFRPRAADASVTKRCRSSQDRARTAD